MASPSDVEQFFGVAGKAGQFREDEPGDMTLANVFQHLLGCRRVFDRFTGGGVQAIHLHHTPISRLRIQTGTAFVRLWRFAADLVFG
jgi:hypothetical protein